METHFYRNKAILLLSSFCILEARDGTIVRAVASHQSDPGSNPHVVVICGVSLLLALLFVSRRFSPGTPVFQFHKKMVDDCLLLSCYLCYLSSLINCSSLTQVIYPIYLQRRLRSVWMGSSYCRLQEWRERK